MQEKAKIEPAIVKGWAQFDFAISKFPTWEFTGWKTPFIKIFTIIGA